MRENVLAATGGRLRFNVAHSNDLMLCAVALDLEVGVDVEHVRQDFAYEGLARRFFAEDGSEPWPGWSLVPVPLPPAYQGTVAARARVTLRVSWFPSPRPLRGGGPATERDTAGTGRTGPRALPPRGLVV